MKQEKEEELIYDQRKRGRKNVVVGREEGSSDGWFVNGQT